MERVQYGLSSFDMVFVFRDFSRAPLHISSVPSTALDDVKQWLEYVSYILTTSSVDVCVTEGAVNLNWGAIMKTINEGTSNFDPRLTQIHTPFSKKVAGSVCIAIKLTYSPPG